MNDASDDVDMELLGIFQMAAAPDALQQEDHMPPQNLDLHGPGVPGAHMHDGGMQLGGAAFDGAGRPAGGAAPSAGLVGHLDGAPLPPLYHDIRMDAMFNPTSSEALRSRGAGDMPAYPHSMPELMQASANVGGFEHVGRIGSIPSFPARGPPMQMQLPMFDDMSMASMTPAAAGASAAAPDDGDGVDSDGDAAGEEDFAQDTAVDMDDDDVDPLAAGPDHEHDMSTSSDSGQPRSRRSQRAKRASQGQPQGASDGRSPTRRRAGRRKRKPASKTASPDSRSKVSGAGGASSTSTLASAPGSAPTSVFASTAAPTLASAAAAASTSASASASASGSSVSGGAAPPKDPATKAALRLKRKAELARVARRKKKMYVHDLEQKVKDLGELLEKTQQDLEEALANKNASMSEEEESLLDKQQAIRQRLSEITKLEQLDEAATQQMTSMSQQFVDNSRERQARAKHYLEKARLCIQPGAQVKFVLWALDQNDEFYSLPGGLWSSLMRDELGVTEQQMQKLFENRAAIHTERVVLNRLQQQLLTAQKAVEEHTTRLNGLMDNLQTILNPWQLAKFYVWVEQNEWCMQMLQ